MGSASRPKESTHTQRNVRVNTYVRVEVDALRQGLALLVQRHKRLRVYLRERPRRAVREHKLQQRPGPRCRRLLPPLPS